MHRHNHKYVFVVVGLALFVAACSAAPAPTTVPPDIPPFETWQEWADWRQVKVDAALRSAGTAWVNASPWEYQREDLGCWNILYEHGEEVFPPTAEMSQAFAECYDAATAAVPPVHPAELSYWLEAQTEYYECVIKLGYDIPPPPSLEVLTAGWDDPEVENWDPRVRTNVEAVNAVCPVPFYTP